MKYRVQGINDKFAWLTYPADGSTISTTVPQFTWSSVRGIQSYGLVVEDASGHWVWKRHEMPATTTSVGCGVSLRRGERYCATLHTFDSNGNQASTHSTFTVE